MISLRVSLDRLNVNSVEGIEISLDGVVTTDGSENQYLRDFDVPSSVIITKSLLNSRSGLPNRESADRNSFKSYIAKSLGNSSETSALATMFFIADIVERLDPAFTIRLALIVEKFFNTEIVSVDSFIIYFPSSYYSLYSITSSRISQVSSLSWTNKAIIV